MYILCYHLFKKEGFIKIYMYFIMFYKTMERKTIKIGKGQNKVQQTGIEGRLFGIYLALGI